MKKVHLALILSLVFIFTLSACSPKDMLGALNTASAEENSITSRPDALYSELARLAADPESVENSDLFDKEITFTVMVFSEPELFEFDEVDGGNQNYIWAGLSRDMDNAILINVDNIQDIPDPYEVISLTGTITGYVYSVEDNETVSVVDVAAASWTALTPSETPAGTQNIQIADTAYSDLKGTFTFKEAQLTADVFGAPTAIVYFEFANEGTEDWAPPVRRLDFYQGDELLNLTISDVDAAIDGSALDAFSAPDDTLVGKTNLYFLTMNGTEEFPLTADTPISACYYDDDFNLVSQVDIPLSPAV